MLVHISLPPHVRPRLRDPLAMPVFRVVARSSPFSAPLFSPPPARPPLALALAPCPRCQTTAGGGPRCRRRFRGCAGWFVLGCLSLLLSLSLSTHTARAASCHFSASARSAAHTIRYNCMMSPGILLLQRAASSGIILRQSESITCQLHPTT